MVVGLYLSKEIILVKSFDQKIFWTWKWRENLGHESGAQVPMSRVLGG